MAKARLSVSLDEEHAARIRATAVRLGEDVSAFMDKAAMDAVRREERKLDVFAEIDAEIAVCEAGARQAPPPSVPTAPDDALEAHRVSGFWDDFFGASGQGAA